MKVNFYKFHGTGNDFIMIDNREELFSKNDTDLIHHLCHRRFGIGADGLILLESPVNENEHFNMVYFNADGIKEGDVIRQIDNIEVRKMSDLTGYINSKRPDDVVNVRIIRNGKERELKVPLTKYETYVIKPIGLEVANASKAELNNFNAQSGVKIIRSLSKDRQSQALIGIIITRIDDEKVSNINDVERVLNRTDPSEPLSVTFINAQGKEQTYIWR